MFKENKKQRTYPSHFIKTKKLNQPCFIKKNKMHLKK